MLTVALACVCVESFLGLDGRTWKGPSRRPGEPGALSFSTEPYFVLHCPFLSRLRNSPLVCSFSIFFWKSKHPIWPSWSFEYPSFLIARCHSVPRNQRIGSSPHLSWASQRPRLSKHYFLSPKPVSHFFFSDCSLTQRCCHWWYLQNKPSGNGLMRSHLTSPQPVSQLVLAILQLNITHYEPLR